MEKLILVGAGGYAKSVLDSVDYFNYTVEGFIDEFSKENEHLGYPILAKSIVDLPDWQQYKYFISVGNNINRKRWFDVLTRQGVNIINVVDKSAIVSRHAQIGTGCFIGKQAIINSNAIIGDDCIINTKALVEHGCKVADHANLSTNSVINGDVQIGEGSFIGSSSTTLGQKNIGSWSTVGAGAVVTNSFGDNVTVAGVPARIISQKATLG